MQMTPTELTNDFPDWKSLSGRTLDGGYELKEIVQAQAERATFRVRVLGDYSLKAAASFYLLENAEAKEQIVIWKSLQTLARKTGLSVPLGTGELPIGSKSAIYLVFQTPDETLEDVLKGRALEFEEAAEVLRSVATGLGELHANGFVHGCISPREVLAIGQDIDLSTDCLRRANAKAFVEREPAKYLAPESGPQNLTTASDIWCLGATLFEALAQKPYEPGLRAEAEALKHPFGTLVARCLEDDPEKRCTLGELDQISRSKAAPPKPKVIPPATLTVTTAEPVHVAAAEDPSKPVQTPKPTNGSVRPGLSERELPPKQANLRNEAILGGSDSEARAGTRNWVYAAGAFIVIFFTLWFIKASHRSQPKIVPAAAQSKQDNTTPVPAPAPAWPTKTLTPDSKPNAAPSEPVRTSQVNAVWRVVLFTYNRQSDAEKKAAWVNGKHADLHAEVFSPSGSGKPYLVVAGGRMTRENAVRERLRALRAGMPRDSYIQNYNR